VMNKIIKEMRIGTRRQNTASAEPLHQQLAHLAHGTR
jgi:hypothetical protein